MDQDYRIAVVTTVLNQKQVTQEFLNSFKNNQDYDNQYIVVDNGSDDFVRNWLLGLTTDDLVIRNESNLGVIVALNQVFSVLKDTDVKYLMYVHNDVMMYEKGWDTKLKRILQHENNRIDIADIKKVGVAGFWGAKGIGTHDIYHAPYVMQQMIRLENVSNCNRMDPVHNYRNIRGGADSEEIAVVDGFSVIVNMDLLRLIGGFDKTFPPHHMYDNDICMESIDKGFRNLVVAMDAQHLGGRTDVGENWEKPFGKTKAEIHRDAHPVFYKKWAPDMVSNGRHKIHLPVRVQ